MLDDEAILDDLQRALAASPTASARWETLSADQVRPLVDWVCQPKLAVVRRRRVHEAVRVLERQPLDEVGGMRIIDELSPPGIEGPSIIDGIFGR